MNRGSQLFELHSERLHDCGLRWEPPVLRVWNPEPSHYTSEISFWIWAGSEVRDVLEFHVFLRGRANTTPNEAVEWLTEQLRVLENSP